MNEALIILALSTFTPADVRVEMTTQPTLVADMDYPYPRPDLVPGYEVAPEIVYPEPVPIQCFGCYRSPYHTYYPGPGYRAPYYGIRHGYWGPRWQHDNYWVFNRYRQGW